MCFFAHAYCYLNLFRSHDSVMVSQYADGAWQIAIGRWAQPLYYRIRGGGIQPLLGRVLFDVFLACDVF